jgi:hypothetical protein
LLLQCQTLWSQWVGESLGLSSAPTDPPPSTSFRLLTHQLFLAWPTSELIKVVDPPQLGLLSSQRSLFSGGSSPSPSLPDTRLPIAGSCLGKAKAKLLKSRKQRLLLRRGVLGGQLSLGTGQAAHEDLRSERMEQDR